MPDHDSSAFYSKPGQQEESPITDEIKASQLSAVLTSSERLDSYIDNSHPPDSTHPPDSLRTSEYSVRLSSKHSSQHLNFDSSQTIIDFGHRGNQSSVKEEDLSESKPEDQPLPNATE
jgi:hypothetical protein